MKSIGIIGGMGPLATADLFGKIIARTEATRDSEHIHIYIDNNTAIPDRTDAILHGGADPRRELIRSAVKLEVMGADFLVMPCNTAHHYYEDIVRQVDIPFLHIVEETAAETARQKLCRVGLLATDGTVQSGIYSRIFEKRGIDVVCPFGEGQKQVMRLIYDGVKASNRAICTDGFAAVMADLESRGAQALILACTELPIAFQMFGFQNRFIDPTAVLAESAVRFAGGSVRPLG